MLDSLKQLEKYLFYILGIIIPLSILAVFQYAPQERVMGDVQRIFYYHVAQPGSGSLPFYSIYCQHSLSPQ